MQTHESLRTSTEEVLDLLSATSHLLSSALDLEATALPAIADLLVPTWAGGCAIGLVEGDALRLVSGRSLTDLNGAPTRRPVGGRRSIVHVNGAGWLLDAPIVAGAEHLGVLRLASSGKEPPSILAPLAEELALRIAIAIDAARTIARERRLADTLQRALLPDRLPRTSQVTFDAAYLPAAGESIVGGDWYDAFELPDGRIALSIGDVAGHGLNAAIIMSEVRQAVRAAALSTRVPSEVLGRANQMLTMRAAPTMVTALYGTYDPAGSTFTYATAGQPAPILGTPDGRVQALPSAGMPLGVVDEIGSFDWTFSLLPGSLLVMYTDGLIEFGRDIFAGEEAVHAAVEAEIVAPSESPAKMLQERVFAAATNSDDVATLTLFVSPRRQESFDFTFSAIPAAAPLVRRALERFAAELGVDDDRRFALVSAVGEAVANSVEHAYSEVPGTVHLTAQCDGDTLRVEIEDSGRWRPIQRSDERGRGIPIMRALMDGVEIRTDRASTKIRMRMELGDAAAAAATATRSAGWSAAGLAGPERLG